MIHSQSQSLPIHQESVLSRPDEWRIMTDQNGVIIDISDSLAVAMNGTRDDLIGRKMLDNLIFENYNDLFEGFSALSQSLSDNGNRMNHFNIGTHKILIGSYQRQVPFHFDWIKNHKGEHFLIGSSVEKSESIDQWIYEPQDIAQQSPEQAEPISVKNQQKVLSATDISVFAAFNTNIMCVLGRDGVILRDNGQLALKGFGTDKYNNLLDFIHPDDKTIIRQHIQTVAANDADQPSDPVTFEARMKTDAGDIRWMTWHIQGCQDTLYCLGHDMTDVKVTELSLKRREQELSEAQALALMGNWRWSVGADEIEWSDQIYAIFGVCRDDFTPTLDNTNAMLHKRDIGHLMQAFQRAIIEQNDYDIDFRVIRPNGQIRYVRCEGRCELDQDGDVTALYGVMQDITAQTEHALELHAAKDAAEQAYASKSRFLANMSHELRTPLNAIIGFSDMIERQMLGKLGNDKYVEYANSIKTSGEHLLALISDILDMSKIEVGKYDLDLEEIDLGDIVHTAVRMIESRAMDGLITIHNDISNSGPMMIADRRAVMQIMLNVLSNAVKFTEPGGEIHLGIEEFENHISIKVTDTGIGIPANKLSSVLRPFEQVSNAFTRNHEGSGLGLAITKELAELHGGMISLESKEGEGTTAHIRLPRNARDKQKK